MEDLISIVVPVYNVEKYFDNCISSIINQTYKRLEIILVDDGSTDNSGKLCDSYKKKDSRIIVIHKENGGLSSARNAGIEIATGKYITFIDSDDDITNDYVEYLYNLIINNKTDMSICSHTVVTLNKRIDYGINLNDVVYNTEDCIKNMLLFNGYNVSACAKMFKLEYIKDISFPIGKLNEDNGTTYKFILKHKKISYGHESKYNYYRRSNSIMKSEFNEKKLDLIEMTDIMCEDIKRVYPSLIDVAIYKQVEARFSILRMISESKKNKKYKSIIKECRSFIINNKKYYFKNDSDKVKSFVSYYSLRVSFGLFKILWSLYRKVRYGD